MISFYPGPSQVYSKIPKWVNKAYKQGYLGMNHRSESFERLVKQTQDLLRSNLKIPADYSCFFTTSATECWEVIAQSLVSECSHHIYNGAFGAKWYSYTKRIHPAATESTFNSNDTLPIDHGLTHSPELIALTHNETSNGTVLSAKSISGLQTQYPDALIALDATSSLGGIDIAWQFGDVWFASVQKCLGLPAGLGLLICSPKALDRVNFLAADNHYNSLINMARNMKKHQTVNTPNVLAIYLLNKVLKHTRSIKRVEPKVKERFTHWMDFISGLSLLSPLVTNVEVQSPTVITLKGTPESISTVLSESYKKGFSLGLGYGELKSTTLRIANFPALKRREINALQKFWHSRNY